MYESRAYDNDSGEPVVVLVVTGTHDVSRLVNLLVGKMAGHPVCEQISVGQRVLRQVRRHNGGRAALQLLAAHGGPELLHEPDPELQRRDHLIGELRGSLVAAQRERDEAQAEAGRLRGQLSEAWTTARQASEYARCDGCTCCTAVGCHAGDDSTCPRSTRTDEIQCPCTGG
jgi:hypothetical protein